MTAPASAQSTASITGTVRDSSNAVLPGVTGTAVQTETGLVRSVVSDESGGYVLASLPVWPYRLEFSLTGFRTAVQTGIVLQVNTNPTIDATLPLGDLTETIQVAAGAPLIDTRSPGIGMVVDNERVEELALNGRLTLDLVYLTGLAAPSGTLSGARGGAAGPGSPGTIAVAGGLPNGTEYLLDGSNHNDPYNNGAMPFPFPEALQEFKVETSALTAQYGYHSAAVVNAVTRSGTNTIHGSAFEFLRDDSMNARDPFASIGPDKQRRSDGLNRNQFGGSLRGPVVRDRLFYFGAYQRTRVRRIPTSSFPLIGAGGGKVERPRGVVGRQRERGTGVRSVERGRNRIAAGHRDPRLIPPQRHVRDGRRIAPRRHLRLTGELLQVRQVVEPPVRDAQRLAAVPPGNEDEPDARRDVPEVVVRQRFSRHRLVAGEDESRRRVREDRALQPAVEAIEVEPRQLSENWMASANYLGNVINHVWWSDQINPAIFGPGATQGNLNQRRVLFLQNPAEGRFYASVQEVRADGRSTYNGLLLQVPRRRAGGFSLQANYTVSRCTTDRFNTGPGVDGFSGTMPGNREADEARCANSPEHNLNASAVYQIPKQGAGVLAAITGGWQIAGILSARSGGYYTVNIGSDVALSGQCCGASGAPHQRANQVLTDPFMPNRTFSQWLNPAAFERPAAGTYGTMPLDAIQGSHRWNIDTALSRSFAAVAGRCRCGLRRSTC